MFRRMSVPILGLVENMSTFVCPHCGEATEIFGRGGGERFAQRNELQYFGGIPLDVKVRQGGDAGVPAVAQREPGRGRGGDAHAGAPGGGAHERARRSAGAGDHDQLGAGSPTAATATARLRRRARRDGGPPRRPGTRRAASPPRRPR